MNSKIWKDLDKISKLEEATLNNWIVDFYTKSDNQCPVENYLDNLPDKTADKIWDDLDRLRLLGNQIDKKHSKHLDDGIFEYRTKVIDGYSRILYFYDKLKPKHIVLTNGFLKKTDKTPSNEIDLAKTYRKDYYSRIRNMDSLDRWYEKKYGKDKLEEKLLNERFNPPYIINYKNYKNKETEDFIKKVIEDYAIEDAVAIIWDCIDNDWRCSAQEDAYLDSLINKYKN